MKTKEFDNVFKLEENHFWFINKRRIIDFYLKKYYKGGLILDSACGTGMDIKDLKEAIGMDYSFDGLLLAYNYCNNLVNGDANFLPFKDKTFSLIFSFDLIQHKNIDVNKVLREYNRVLKKGGFIFLNLPMFNFLYSYHDHVVENSKRFSTRDFKIFKSYGFTIKEKSFWNFLFLLPIIFYRKVISNFLSYNEYSDVRPLKTYMNKIFDNLFKLEFFLLKRGLLPVGVSSFVILSKQVDL